MVLPGWIGNQGDVVEDGRFVVCGGTSLGVMAEFNGNSHCWLVSSYSPCPCEFLCPTEQMMPDRSTTNNDLPPADKIACIIYC